MKTISDELMKEITKHMNEEVKDWTEHTYLCCENEEFLKQYFLRLIFDEGEEVADSFEWLLWNEFNVDIMHYVTYAEKMDAVNMFYDLQKWEENKQWN